MIIAPTDEGYLQHYFDSRGVVRLYRMSLEDRTWTLQRTEPDFSSLEFSQRYVGIFSDDGNRVDGAWETSYDDGQTWQIDFPLSYTRVIGEPPP